MSAARIELIHRTAASDTVTHFMPAYLTTVSVDDAGAPIEFPRLIVDGPDASRRSDEAQLRREIRLAAPADLHELLRADRPSSVA